jgi:hypothetical protein
LLPFLVGWWPSLLAVGILMTATTLQLGPTLSKSNFLPPNRYPRSLLLYAKLGIFSLSVPRPWKPKSSLAMTRTRKLLQL